VVFVLCYGVSKWDIFTSPCSKTKISRERSKYTDLGYGLHDLSSNPRKGKIFVLFFQTSTGSGSHPAPCSRDTAIPSREQSSRGVKFTNHISPPPRLRIRGAITFLPLHASVAWTGKTMSAWDVANKFYLVTYRATKLSFRHEMRRVLHNWSSLPQNTNLGSFAITTTKGIKITFTHRYEHWYTNQRTFLLSLNIIPRHVTETCRAIIITDYKKAHHLVHQYAYTTKRTVLII
jgi:hypothetical protein